MTDKTWDDFTASVFQGMDRHEYAELHRNFAKQCQRLALIAHPPQVVLELLAMTLQHLGIAEDWEASEDW